MSQAEAEARDFVEQKAAVTKTADKSWCARISIGIFSMISRATLKNAGKRSWRGSQNLEVFFFVFWGQKQADRCVLCFGQMLKP